MNNFKSIDIGELIKKRWEEMDISLIRTCRFFKLEEKAILDMFQYKTIDTEMLIKWSKLLEYDFFRLYSQHLLLYSPQSIVNSRRINSGLPQFRKNIYTREIIFFILKLIQNGEKTKQQVIEEYCIPKTTLYKWITKYQSDI